jgi:hypothetical protein
VAGRYEVILTVGGETFRQPLIVKMDPRVTASAADLQAQLDLARQMTDGMESSYRSYYDIAELRRALLERQQGITTKPELKDVGVSVAALIKEIEELADGANEPPGFGPINRDLARYLIMIESGDMRPAKSAQQNAAVACEALKTDLAKWRLVNSDKLAALNGLLQKNGFSAVPTVLPPADPICR